MSGNGHGAWLGWVLELTMASLLAHLPPAVAFDQLDDLAHLHAFLSDGRIGAGTVGRRA
jgi:hypothetical protein